MKMKYRLKKLLAVALSVMMFGGVMPTYAAQTKDGTENVTANESAAYVAPAEDPAAAGGAAKEDATGAAAFKPAKVSEIETESSVTEYLKNHADKSLVGDTANLTAYDILSVSTTVADGSVLGYDANLDRLWEDRDGDGFAEDYSAMLSHADWDAMLYQGAADAGYLAAWVGADIEGAKLTDFYAADNDGLANLRDGFIMDGETGIVYVPKKYSHDENGAFKGLTSRIQLMYVTKDASADISFGFSSDVAKVKGDIAGEGKVSVPAAAVYTRIILAEDDRAGKAVKDNTVDAVRINDVKYTSDDGVWQYNRETGALEISLAPSAIRCVNVEMSSSFGKSVKNAVRTVGEKLGILPVSNGISGLNNLGDWGFSRTPNVGDNFVAASTNEYPAGGAGEVLATPGIIKGGLYRPELGNYNSRIVQECMHQAANGQDGRTVDTNPANWNNYFKIYGNSFLRKAAISDQYVTLTDGTVVYIPSSVTLALICAHCGVNPSGWVIDGTGDDRGGFNQQGVRYDTLGAYIYVIAMYANYAIIGVTVPTQNTQAGAGFYEINWHVTVQPKVKILKKSADTGITDGNSCYSLEGAEYGVFTGPDCSGEPIGRLTTNAAGETEELDVSQDTTYYVKELKAPKGYALDTNVYTANVTDDTCVVEVSDVPQSDPVSVLLKKESKIPGGGAVNNKPLKDAEFEVKFYAELLEDANTDPATQGHEAARTWVFKTDEDGYCRYANIYLSSGDELYKTTGGYYQIPIGTITIKEIKAPDGYLINPEVFVRQITPEGVLETVQTYNYPVISEDSIDLNVFKVLKGKKTPIANAEFTLSKPDGTKEILKSDKAGKLIFKALGFGRYSLKETKAPDGYLLNEGVITFTVNEDGAIEFDSDSLKKDGISLEATGTGGNVTYEDELAPYTILIHKVSDADKPLEGAEFALYADKDLKKVVSKGVTDKDGTLRFEKLTVGTTYFLTETKAPTGYRMPLDEDGKPPVTEIKVTSDPEKDLFDLYIDGVKRDFKDGYELTGTKAERQVDITVINEHGAPLPDTGSSLTLTIIVAAVVLTAVVLLTRKKHRKDSGKDDTNDVK